ncbi:endonuclease/exonuclease/phosphatase family protein [Cellulosimicrobium cellulans]|uniref:endonuclease/exonuclease/phosphatase family protein n=1 Tax=Cellulosimicrobium cellulans TaxID=1710 RepID=UPI001EDB7988|nr:endonuclease/exonuclease/phosphatase family protein [Cellulosimicrobium cellulans]UKJ63611.1 endonuclease/exonuclease/phosphatase family protein [Cellulosimicrobium cellulans]
MTSATTSLPPARVTTRRRPGGPVLTVLLAVGTVGVVLLTLVRAVPYDAVTPFAQVVGCTPFGALGSGLWSALPLDDVDVEPFSNDAMPSATVEVDGVPVRVTAVHPIPPIPEYVRVWGEETGALAERAAADPLPQVLVGDFNATHDHATFRRLLGDRFHDASRESGSGLDLSWSPRPGTVPPVLNLDHVVTDRENVVTDVVSLPVPGSDHRAIVATVHVPRP